MTTKTLNNNLTAAKRNKNDEFYTQLVDIENEMKHYRDHFKGKTVLLNCDDPRESKFFHYFSFNFEKLGLKKLISTCYKDPSTGESSVYLEYTGDKNGNRVPDAEEIGIHPLKGNGDFRSEDSIALLKEADIVVTNPPFSLFREFVAQLVEHDKKFIVVGSMNAITYKEVFKHIKFNDLWLGVNNGGNKWFAVPDDYDINTKSHIKIEDGVKYIKLRNVAWFTNLDIVKRHEDLILYKKYNSDDYPTYDNYDAINVDKLTDIPMDYAGAMGVPITFLNKYNPDQFEIVKFRKGDDERDLVYTANGNTKTPYFRILIRNKQLGN